MLSPCMIQALMNCISYACYMKLIDLPLLKMISAMLVQSATGHDVCLIGLTSCKLTIGKSQFRHTFIMCKKLQNELVIGHDMQQLHYLGCNWTNDG